MADKITLLAIWNKLKFWGWVIFGLIGFGWAGHQIYIAYIDKPHERYDRDIESLGEIDKGLRDEIKKNEAVFGKIESGYEEILIIQHAYVQQRVGELTKRWVELNVMKDMGSASAEDLEDLYEVKVRLKQYADLLKKLDD